MAQIKIELDTDDRVVVNAFANALAEIAGHSPAVIEQRTAEAVEALQTKPTPEAVAEAAAQVQPDGDTTEPTRADVVGALESDDDAVDSRGIKWDERIHSSNRKTLAKGGHWQRKRGVDTVLADRLEAEAVAALGDTPPPPPPANDIDDPASVFAPPPPPADTTTTWTYAEVVKAMTEALTANKISPTDVQAACVENGAPALPPLSNNPEALANVAAKLGLVK